MDISAIMDVFHNAMRTGLRAKKDTKNRIRVRVLSTPVYTTEREAGALTGLPGKSAHIGEFRFKGRIVEPDWVHNPHLFLDDPCSIENAKDTLATIAAIQCHTTFISTKSANGNQDMPKIDDIVMANFDPNEFSINMERAEYVGMNTESDGSQGPELRSTQQYCQSIADNFKNTATGISNLGSIGNILHELQKNSKSATSDQVVEGKELPMVGYYAKTEIDIWKGKKESDPEMWDVLNKYWTNIKYPFSESYRGGKPHWSSAFISYVMTNVDSSFPKNSAHYLYVDSAVAGEGGWTSWDISSGKIKAQVGDILVAPRTGKGTTETSTHGDVVYKVENDNAYLAGGNMSNTAKETQVMPLTTEGYYKSTGNYLVILKKNGSIVEQAVA